MALPYDTGGWDLGSISPSDAAVTLRGLPRRFRETLARLDSPPASAVAAIDAAATSILATDQALAAVLVHDDPAVTLPDPTTGGAGTDATAALRRLERVTTTAADRINGATGDQWTRTGHAGSDEVTALDVARASVYLGVSRLRMVERLATDD